MVFIRLRGEDHEMRTSTPGKTMSAFDELCRVSYWSHEIRCDSLSAGHHNQTELQMRAFSRLASTHSKFALALLVAAACQRDLPTDAVNNEAAVYARHTTAAPYTSVNLGVLSGDNSSRANAVNDAGEAVGYSCCSPNSRAFVTLNGTLTALSGDAANALAISNGSTR
jgi:hypothetical protein